jgi:dipeptidyl aminopeptidase/acylaminoacyl peptidase
MPIEAETMHRDIRGTALYKEAEALYRALRQPGTGQISDVQELHVSPDGHCAVFAGTVMDVLEGTPPTRICLVNLTSGDTRMVTFGPNVDRLPKFAPDGRRIAFLSDRHNGGDFQLHLLDPVSGAAIPTPAVEGWVEYLHWSPDSKRILLGVAGHGSDISGAHGAITSKQVDGRAKSWMPVVETGHESYRWRRAWVYELATNHVCKVSTDVNIWEAVWCGNKSIAAVVSTEPGEGLWYGARLRLIEIETGDSREIYAPPHQVGWPSASISGKALAIVQAICSDRWMVAGELLLIDTVTGTIRLMDTKGVDVTYTEWRSEQELLVAGHRRFETVVGLCDAASGAFIEKWCSKDISGTGRYVTVSGFGEPGDCALAAETFKRGPEIGMLRRGMYRTLKSFDLGYGECARAIQSVECVSWNAPDGLEIQGWLLRPHGNGPYPLIMNIHGGPVWQWHPLCLGRTRYAPFCMLLNRGYAVFLPNPRGSSGRGQEYAGRVLGEMGGADTHDYLTGLDHLVKQGIADPRRLGVTGVSYGGFMTAWLITQDTRFAAAVPIAPVTNHVTEHLISNIPQFVKLFLADAYTNHDGKYYQYSPILHAQKAKTPTLSICGALDRCTPSEEAVQFHNALLENGVKSVLVTYPEEGHGIHKLPACIDFAARLVGWFEQYMGAEIELAVDERRESLTEKR